MLSPSEWACYDGPVASEIQRYADQIHRSDGLVWVFPTWNYGLPAILKGYVDRVWKPNVAFRLDGTRRVHFDMFENLKFFIVATTYGAGWIANTFVGNPCKSVIVRGLRRHFPASSEFAWFALYGMDRPSPRRMEGFLARVRSAARAVARERQD